MNAVRKPTEDKDTAARETKRLELACSPPAGTSETERPSASPVHVLRARIEAALRPPSERAMLRISAMVLVLALSSWLAVAMLLSAGS